MAKIKPWYETKDDAKKAFAEKPGLEIMPIPWHIFLYSVTTKWPGAVRLQRSSGLIYAWSEKGFRRLAGVTEGVTWPPHSGTDYDIKTGVFSNTTPAFEPGRFTGPYMAEIYPLAQEQVYRDRMEAHARSRKW